MHFSKGFKKPRLQLFSFFSALKATIIKWFNPLVHSTKEINEWVAARKNADQLYHLLIQGKTSHELFTIITRLATSTRISPETSAKAHLLLSLLYQKDIDVPGFKLVKENAKASFHRQRAVDFYGPNLPFIESVERYLSSIELGGESHFAWQTLTKQAQDNSNTLRNLWAHKLLSYVYRNGVDSSHLHVIPDVERAAFHHRKSFKRFVVLEEKFNQLIVKLKRFWLNRDKAFELIKKLADCNHKNACYEYANQLQGKKHEAEFLHYLKIAADNQKESHLEFKKKGILHAKNQLDALLPKRKVPHAKVLNCYEVFSKNQTKELDEILPLAEEENLSSLLQAVFICIERNDICNAEKYFSKSAKIAVELVAHDQQEKFEALCLKLADYYENEFIADASTYKFTLNEFTHSLVKKIIYYLESIPPDSKHYAEAQFRIAHYQKYFLNNKKEASLRFQQLSRQNDPDCAKLALTTGFALFWSSWTEYLPEHEKAVVQQYEKENKYPLMHNESRARTKSSLQETSISLIKKVVDEIQAYNDKQTIITHKIPEVAELKEKIEEYEKNIESLFSFKGRSKPIFEFASRIDPEIKKMFSDFWKSDGLHSENSANFSYQKAKLLSGYQPLLKAYLETLLVIRDQQKFDDPGYFRLLEKAYLNYIVKSCQDIFAEYSSNSLEEIVSPKGIIGHV